jgi:1,2-diacylglycerol 3-alpha-glucosyltransferase
VNILMISDVYHPRVNGVSTSIETFRRDLQSAGHRVHLVAPAYAATNGDAAAEVDISRIAGRPVPRDPEDRLLRWGDINRRLQELGREPWDVVHVHTPFLAHYAGLRAAQRIGAPLVITYHTLFEEYLHHYFPFVPRSLTRALARRLSRRQCHQADGVVVPSRAMVERLESYGVVPELMHILPTGLPADIYERGDGAAFRRAHDIPPDRPVALFVGRAAHEKNIGFLLEAMRTVRVRVPEALLLIAGEGPAADDLRRRSRQLGIAEQVRFLGYMARGKPLANCYAAADVFAFASRTETQGLVLLEAMAQGLPVLALAEMGTRDILDGCPGAVIGLDRADGFAEQLADLLADRTRCRQLGEAALGWAHRWQGPALAQRLVDFYATLPQRRHIGRTDGAAATV